MRAITLTLPLALLLTGCSSNGHTPDQSEPTPEAVRADSTQASAPSSAERLGGAVVAPLNDLNLIRTKIPEVLKQAQRAPYGLPSARSCADLAAEVRLLDAALGADLDAPHSDDNPSLLERGSDEAGNAAVGALKSASEGLLPFRGWLRKLSGAERYSKQVAAAISAGGVRRAFLKGLGQSQGCEPPASPLPPAPPAESAKQASRTG